MLIIRLKRTGSRNNPDFRLVLAEKHRSAVKKVLEVFGDYNPKTKILHLADEAKLKLWLDRSVELSPTVHNLLVQKKLLAKAKVKAWRPKKSTKEAAAAPADAPAAKSETKKEEPPAEAK